ncbi:imidazole glycerol phosphate synthase subunit HisH [Salinibacterium sp. GXW1014]|uniref:imidazole glycerol phosphate synthase subunit HisH n=1 Tax=Salinibacterium sp. GXW1014 TaxID=3377838 RepID=UPI00383B1A05
MTVTVIDYGGGNIGSVVNMLKRVGSDVAVVREPAEIASSERILLPGVGAFDRGVSLLKETGFFEPIRAFAVSGRPVLGICLGMQLLADSSEEGELRGLGLIPGAARRFAAKPGLRIPHMGWNAVVPRDHEPLLDGIAEENRFYFVHSYHVEPADESHVAATTGYGSSFVSMIRRDNVVGAQFHPEKSHDFGKTLLKNFAAA